MVRKIDERRRVRIKVFRFREDTGEKEFWFSCLFDRQGREIEGEECPPDLKSLFSSLAEAQPPISGTERMGLIWRGIPFSLSLLRYISMTLGELPDLRAEMTPEQEGVADCGQNRRFTWRELKEASDALASSLIKIGLEKGDKVAVIMDNCWENIVSKLAVEKAGGITVNLNIHEKGEMLERLLKGADVKILLVRQRIKAREHMELLYEICPELRHSTPDSVRCAKLPALRTVIVTDRKKPRSCAWQLEDLIDEGRTMDPGPLREREKTIDPLSTATILHTSGSSGIPKGVMLTHSQLIESALVHVKKMELTDRDRFCMTSPMFHALGCIGSVLASVTAGSTLVFHGSVRCAALPDVLRKDTFTPVILEKLEEYDSQVISHVTWNDDDKKVTASILDMIEEGADVVICTGGMSVDPDDKTPLAIKNTGARIVSYGAPVLPGAMFLLAYYEKNGKKAVIMGLPGCVMYAKRTIFDLILPRVMADDPVTPEELAALGEGGLCLNCEPCVFPNCGFGKGH